MIVVLHYTLAGPGKSYTELYAYNAENKKLLSTNPGTWSRAFMLEYFTGIIKEHAPDKVLVEIDKNQPQALSAKTVSDLKNGRDHKDYLI